MATLNQMTTPRNYISQATIQKTKDYTKWLDHRTMQNDYTEQKDLSDDYNKWLYQIIYQKAIQRDYTKWIYQTTTENLSDSMKRLQNQNDYMKILYRTEVTMKKYFNCEIGPSISNVR